MPKARGNLFVVLAVAHCLLTAPATVAAEESEYQKAVSEGIAEFERGNYNEANAFFRKAHQIEPSARTLRGLGMTAFETREYVKALTFLEQALSDKRKPLTESQRKEVKKLLKHCRVFIATYEVELNPANASLTVDGLPGKIESGRLLLNPGERELVVRAEGYKELMRKVKVEGGYEGRLTLELEPRSDTAPAPVAAPSEEPAPEAEPVQAEEPTQAEAQPAEESEPEVTDEEEEDRPVVKLLPWVVMGTGGAMLIGGTVTGLMTNNVYSDMKDGCGEQRLECTLDEYDKKQKGETLQLVTNILLMTGAATATAGLIWFLLSRESSAEESGSTEVAMAPSCVSDGCWLIMRGFF